MPVSVSSYQKHINGKLVTVAGYEAERDGIPNSHTPIIRENVAREEGQQIAPPGQFVQHTTASNILRGVGGLTAYLAVAGGKTSMPVYRFRQTILPTASSLRKPKSQGGQ